jgi:acylglycerol lipase
MRSVSLVVLVATLLGWFVGCASTRCAVRAMSSPAPRVTASGAVHREGVFAGVGGLCLYEQSWRPGAGAPRGVLVIVHGLRDHSARYAAVAEALAARGIAVYAFDLRGHGRSAGWYAYVAAFDEYLADLDRFVARVRAREPGVPLFLLGHSMGGAIATLYTITRRPALRGLVLSAPALDVAASTSGAQVAGARFLSALIPTAGVFVLDPAGFSRDPAVRRADERDPLVHAVAAARTASELIAAFDRIRRGEASLAVPLYIIHGTADRITPPAGSRRLYARAGSRDRTLRLYPGLYHDLWHEPEHAAVRDDLLHWIDAHLAAP